MHCGTDSPSFATFTPTNTTSTPAPVFKNGRLETSGHPALYLESSNLPAWELPIFMQLSRTSIGQGIFAPAFLRLMPCLKTQTLSLSQTPETFQYPPALASCPGDVRNDSRRFLRSRAEESAGVIPDEARKDFGASPVCGRQRCIHPFADVNNCRNDEHLNTKLIPYFVDTGGPHRMASLLVSDSASYHIFPRAKFHPVFRSYQRHPTSIRSRWIRSTHCI